MSEESGYATWISFPSDGENMDILGGLRIRLEAVPNAGDGSVFRRWSFRNPDKDGTDAEDTAEAQDILLTSGSGVSSAIEFVCAGNYEIYAVFGGTATISIDSDGTLSPEAVNSFAVAEVRRNGGNPTTEVDFEYGDEIVMSAGHDTEHGVYFVGWKKNGEEAFASNSCTYTVVPDEGRVSYTAVFSANPPVYLVRLSRVQCDSEGYWTSSISAPDELEPLTAGQWVEALSQRYGGSDYDNEAWGISLRNDTLLKASASLIGGFEIHMNDNPSATIVRWTIQRMSKGGRFGFDLSQETTLMEGPDSGFQFVPDGDCIIRAHCLRDSVDPGAKTTIGYVQEERYLPDEDLLLLGMDMEGGESYPPDNRHHILNQPDHRVEFNAGDVGTYSISAASSNAYRFIGWFYRPTVNSAYLYCTSPDITIESFGSTFTGYARYAAYEIDDNGVKIWEGSSANKTLVWRSRRFASEVPFNPAAARVLADGYPVTLKIDMSSSPNDPVSEEAGRHAELTVASQDARRTPRLRPEKYLELEVRSDKPVLQLSVATAMAGLRG